MQFCLLLLTSFALINVHVFYINVSPFLGLLRFFLNVPLPVSGIYILLNYITKGSITDSRWYKQLLRVLNELKLNEISSKLEIQMDELSESINVGLCFFYLVFFNESRTEICGFYLNQLIHLYCSRY